MNNESERINAEKFNGCAYHDIAIMKENKNDKKLGHKNKSARHKSAKETMFFKMSKFFVSKSEMPKYMCEFTESKKV